MLIRSNSPKGLQPADSRSAGKLAAAGFVGWLMLAATPVFAIMALLTAFDGGAQMICSSMGASPLGGMAPMYALMSVFHMPAWMQLIARARLKASGISPEQAQPAPDGLWLS